MASLARSRVAQAVATVTGRAIAPRLAVVSRIRRFATTQRSEAVDTKTVSSSPTPTAATTAATATSPGTPYNESPDVYKSDGSTSDWSRSFSGLGAQAFPKEVADVLQAPLDPSDVEVKPDGLIYLPEIKYRRILNKAFGPGGWGLAPRSETNVSAKIVSREYGLICMGRLVGIARGEQEYFDPTGIATATESCKSNALMRCCKDLGVASELWDPRFIREFKANFCVQVFVTHVVTTKKQKLWRRKDSKFDYPWKEG